jgi:hypothetical protein
VSGDLTARVAELAALIEKQLGEDEAWAKVAAEVDGTGKWEPAHRPEMGADYRFIAIDSCQVRIQATDAGTVIHAARHDPARALRRVKATRDLVTAILAEGAPGRRRLLLRLLAGAGGGRPDLRAHGSTRLGLLGP